MWEGKHSTPEVSSNLMVKNIEGVRAKSDDGSMSSTVDLLKINVGLNVGSASVQMNNVVIKVSDGTATHNLVYAGNDGIYGKMASFDLYSATNNLKNLLTGAENPARYYTMEKIRDEDFSFSQANPVMNTGDLVTIYIATTSTSATGNNYLGSIYAGDLANSALNIAPGTAVQITLTPDAGAITTAEFITPSSYGTRGNVQLYP
jgi:flagellin FlaB